MFLFNKLFCLSRKSSQKVTLLDMPDLVMRKILEDCDLFSILNLRKVCRGFRDFINHTKPESTLECITLYVCPNEIEMALEILKNGNLGIHHVVYLKHFNGCTIQYESYKKEKYIKFGNDDFRNVFFNDLKAVLESRGSTLKRFELRVESKFQRFLDFNCWDMFKLDLWKNEGDFEENLAFTLKSIKDYLKSRVQPFKVSFLFMEIEKQEELMQWLPYFDSKSLSIVKVHNTHSESNPYLQMDKILKVEALRSIDMLGMYSFTVWEPVEKFSIIPSVYLKCASISKEELLSLKETLFSSPTFVYFRVGLPTAQYFTLDELISMFGPATSEWKAEWSFEIPGSDKVHKVYWSHPDPDFLSEIKFTRDLNLRKVCYGLREFINYSKPISTLSGIVFSLRPNEIALSLNVLNNGRKKDYYIYYSEEQNNTCGCYRKYGGDWEENMVFVLKSIKDHLVSRVKPLKVESVYMRTSNQDNLMEWLPYFDSKYLNQLRIKQIKMEDYLEINKIFELDTLKNINRLVLKCFIRCNSLHYLSNIPYVFVGVKSISAQELLSLKETLFRSPSSKHFQIIIRPMDLEFQELFLILRPPIPLEKEWCFSIPGTDEVNKIHWRSNWGQQEIAFTREKRPVN